MKTNNVILIFAFTFCILSATSSHAGSNPNASTGGADDSASDAATGPDTGGASSTASNHPVGIGANISTLGLGGQVAVGLKRKLDLRGGVNFFRLTRTKTSNGITYDAGVHLGNGDVLLDWFPWANSFHLTPGFLVYNGNKITGDANVAGGQSFTLNNFTYYSSTTNPVTGTGSIEVNKVAPMILFGWGTLVPRTKHWSVNFDAGVVFWGSPKVTLNFTGDVCGFRDVFCRSIASDPTVQANIKAQEAKYNSDASSYKVFPVLSFGVGYRF